MTRILLVGSSPDTVESVRASVQGAVFAIHAEPYPSAAAELFPLLQGAPKPDVALLEPGEALDEGLALAAELVRGFGVSVILLTDQEQDIALRALRAGVTDVLPVAADPVLLAEAILRTPAVSAASTAVPAPAAAGGPNERGRLVAVVSPKGGVGKTTVATNIAVGLAKKAPQSTVLVDLDIHFGDVASALNLTPEYSLPDVTQPGALADTMALKSLLTLHESGLYVIPGSDSPAAADAVTASSVSRLLEVLATQFRYVVVDTAPGLSEHTLAVLDATDTLVMVTSLDVPGVRGLRKELDTLNDLGMITGSRTIVLNFFDTSRGLTVADVEATIRTKVDIVLPASKLVPLSVNQGIPLLRNDVRDPVTKGLAKLVDILAPEGAPAPTKGLFGGFARRSGKG